MEKQQSLAAQEGSRSGVFLCLCCFQTSQSSKRPVPSLQHPGNLLPPVSFGGSLPALAPCAPQPATLPQGALSPAASPAGAGRDNSALGLFLLSFGVQGRCEKSLRSGESIKKKVPK